MDFFMLADMARDLDVPCNGVMADHQHADNHVHEFIFTGEFSVCRQCGVTDSQHVQFENAEEGFRGPEATEGTSRLGLENAQDTLFSEGFRLATRVGDRRLNNINRRICSNNKDSKIYADGNFISEMCVKLSLHSDTDFSRGHKLSDSVSLSIARSLIRAARRLAALSSAIRLR